MTSVSFYYFLWRLISVRRVRASNGRQNRFLYRSHRNGQSRKNIVFMRLCGVSGIHFSRRGEQIILLFFMYSKISNSQKPVLLSAGRISPVWNRQVKIIRKIPPAKSTAWGLYFFRMKYPTTMVTKSAVITLNLKSSFYFRLFKDAFYCYRL